MILVDTGYFIALGDASDGVHARAMAWAHAIRGPLLVTEYVFMEVMNHFSGRADRRRAYSLADRILDDAGYVWLAATPSLLSQGLNLYRRARDKDWSLTDCISMEVMRDRGLTRALTHDHHFEQAGFEALLRRDPP